MSILMDYINEYINGLHLDNKIRKCDMILPTEELAYKVLKMWNICSEKKRRSIRATAVTLTYENMAKKLKAIYIRSGNSASNNDNFDVNWCITLINHKIIPTKDQKMVTEAIIVSTFVTKVVIFQIGLSCSKAQIRKTTIKPEQKTNPFDKSEKVMSCLLSKRCVIRC